MTHDATAPVPADPMPEDLIRFWIDETGPAGWYQQSDDLDRLIRDRFMAAWIDAPRLAAAWAGSATGTLAALILTDQFPRNMFRNDARAFSTDPLALRIARAALDTGHDLATPEPARQFFYLPFEHSEELADQDLAVELFAQRMPGENLLHAQLHRDTIARFGRFPWRNEPLGRAPTAAESAVMKAGGYGALVSGRLSLADLP